MSTKQLCVLALFLGLSTRATAAEPPSWNVAFYNIQSGKGEAPLPGRTAPFVENHNCTDPTQPMNAWGAEVYFASSGTHTVRVQTREDGLAIDQVVLSALRFRTSAPGALLDDATILPR